MWDDRTRVFGKLEGNVPVLLIDGLAAGTWEKQKARNLAEIIVRPFKRFTKDQKRIIEEEAGLLGEFFETSVKVSYSTWS